MMKQDIVKRLTQLRQLMQTYQADFYFVPSADPHKNEYLPACFERRAWMSGFTGSAGDVVVGKNKAYLWTDPRYFLQAEQQLDSAQYQLMKLGQGETPPIDQWLAAQGDHLIFATDPKVISIQQAQKISAALAEHHSKLLTIEDNLIDQLWQDRPTLPCTPIRLHPEKYAGESTQNKLTRVREQMATKGVDALVITLLDAIAWVFNIRGNDVAYNPVIISYAIITEKTAVLFIDLNKITDTDKKYFSQTNITLSPYDSFKTALNQLSGTVWVDPNTASYWVAQQLKQANLYLAPSPITLLKAIKNPVEQAGAREAHRLDAIAVINCLHWLENHWQEGVTEISVANKLAAFRQENKDCLDLSFATIAGFGTHGAIIHYQATPQTDIAIDDSSLLVLDSGGQYLFGTTDITRTIHLGTPTPEQKHYYTLVLKGHLALRHAVFPAGSCGEHIDAFAHQFLWREGLDYGHGTGHGVGSYLCVHEGPQVISKRITNVPLQPGMIVSNEPGLYLANQYGMRIENLCVITEKYPNFYTLDDLTLVPYCRALIEIADLTALEIQWINEYHQQVYQILIDAMPTPTLREWLARATADITTSAMD